MTKSIAKKSTTGSLPPAVPLAITPTFSPWTHTSDDSYVYQLSLVLATATVSYWYYRTWYVPRILKHRPTMPITKHVAVHGSTNPERLPATLARESLTSICACTKLIGTGIGGVSFERGRPTRNIGRLRC